MTRSAGVKITLSFLLIVAGGLAADAVEVCLRPEHSCRSPVVRLGDLAEIRGADGERTAALAAVELFPAPAPHRTRLVRAGELRELLELHGMDPAELRLSGAAAAVVYGDKPSGAGEPTTPELRRAKERAEQAILRHLRTTAPNAPWQVSAELDSRGVEVLASPLRSLTVEGGREPWAGKQQFVVATANSQGATRVPVQANVSLPDAIVVAARAIQRGQVIGERDVQMAPAQAPDAEFQPLRRLEDAVAKEALRGISAGQPIDSRSIQPAQLVRRGEIVTVFARAAGVQVSTQARALEDGSLNDLVQVESSGERRRYTATVTGLQEVEVCARDPSAARDRPSAAAGGKRLARKSQAGRE
jgi:flagella basal body P-ring formation protein FlgA